MEILPMTDDQIRNRVNRLLNLLDLGAYVPLKKELLDWREEVLPPEPEPKTRNEIAQIIKTPKVTYQLEFVKCGKNCKKCPHGPYWYAYWSENGKTKNRYIGKKITEEKHKQFGLSDDEIKEWFTQVQTFEQKVKQWSQEKSDIQ